MGPNFGAFLRLDLRFGRPARTGVQAERSEFIARTWRPSGVRRHGRSRSSTRLWRARSGPAEGLNHRFRICAECPWLRTVGVVRDVHQRALDVVPRPEYFISHLQVPQLGSFAAPQDLAVRTEGNPKALATAVRRAVWEVDPQQPLAQVKIMSEYLEEDMAPRRFKTQLLSGFATLALILAALGPVCSSFL